MKLSYQKAFFVFVLLFTVFFLTGCHSSKAEKAVISELELIKQLDEETIRSFISYEDMMSSDAKTSSIGEETTEAVQLFFKHFDYRILSSSTSKEQASVKVRLTNLDMKSLAHDLYLSLSARSADPRTSVPALTMRDYFSLLGSVLKTHTYKIISSDTTIELTKLSDGSWSIQNTSDLEDALVGGFITYLKDKDLVSPEEIVPLTFDCFLKFTPADWISYLNMDDIFQTGSSLSSSLDQEVASQISRYFRYQIVSSSIDGNHATVIVTVTSLNLESILEDYRQKLLSYASTTEAIRATDQELAEKTAQLLLTSLKANDATFSQNIEVHLVNNGFSWSVQLDETFTDAVLGNSAKAAAALTGETETEV